MFMAPLPFVCSLVGKDGSSLILSVSLLYDKAKKNASVFPLPHLFLFSVILRTQRRVTFVV